MFGHQDDQIKNNQSDTTISEPIPDGTLALDSTTPLTSVSPTSAPLPKNDGVDLPEIDDAASGYIMTDAPHAKSDGKPTIDSSQTDALLNIKQQALQQLSPLVGHLEQSPEEKFRTTMMMIQASDDQSLVKAAYEAAKEIKDEKTRAQALLDVVNEINYFTQQQEPAA